MPARFRAVSPSPFIAKPSRIDTGASVAYNLGGILGASLAPYLAQRLLDYGGLSWVGYYLTLAAVISFVSVARMRETGRR